MPSKLCDNVKTAKQLSKEDILRELEAMANISNWEIDLITNESIWSEQSYKIYALDKETTKPSIKLFYSHLVEEDVLRAHTTFANLLTSKKAASLECSIIDAKGNKKYLVMNAKVIFDKDDNPLKMIGTTQDITEISMLKKNMNEFSRIMHNSLNEIYIVDYDTQEYLYVNNGACQALGYTQEELLKMKVYDINPYLTLEEVNTLKKKYNENNGTLLVRAVHQKKDKTFYHAQSYIHSITYKDKKAYVIFDTDISDLIKLEEQIKHQATHDSLTSLPNRALFNDRLTQIIKGSKRNNEKFALLFIDLDQFKKINDTLGHYIGDEVLKIISSRLEKSIRADDTLARLGGDEFTIILKNIIDISDISKICIKIIEEVKKPMIVDGHTLNISTSIGISKYPQDADNEKDLIKYADIAMYKTKDEGRDGFKYFSTNFSASTYEKILLDNSIRVAIKEEQFIVYYQPQYNITTNEITGMEALVRWRHPLEGLISPAKFIPIAEDNGLIIEIDKIVMKKAMQQFAFWHKEGLNPGILALNLAIKQLNKDEFVPMLIQTMKDLNFNPEWLEFEVAESQVMSNAGNCIKKLKELSELGIEIAIDDFGTGYSSLAYLKKLPLDKLKIDKSFIRDISSNEDDTAITKAIIALAQSLNLKTIAEGVEDELQKEFLINNGCNNVQGYLFAKPLPADKITKLLREIKG